jgi:hypothetical protein
VFRFARHIAEFAPQFSELVLALRMRDGSWHELLSLHSQLDGEVAQTTTLLRLYMVQALLQRLNEVPYTTTT